MIKKVWRGEPEGVRPLGRPRMRWRDQVEKDLRTIGATLEVAQDRGSWRDIVGEVKNHLGFEWPQDSKNYGDPNYVKQSPRVPVHIPDPAEWSSTYKDTSDSLLLVEEIPVIETELFCQLAASHCLGTTVTTDWGQAGEVSLFTS
ncbi:hypothetical protein J6590_078395 [Homalodisca vitripennis]|nr:hypothetical protein J6590_078395 [Homalodisca vitripennis]